jgi:hypothetical protein
MRAKARKTAACGIKFAYDILPKHGAPFIGQAGRQRQSLLAFGKN